MLLSWFWILPSTFDCSSSTSFDYSFPCLLIVFDSLPVNLEILFFMLLKAWILFIDLFFKSAIVLLYSSMNSLKLSIFCSYCTTNSDVASIKLIVSITSFFITRLLYKISFWLLKLLFVKLFLIWMNSLSWRTIFW